MIKKISASLFAFAIATSLAACSSGATTSAAPEETVVLQTNKEACDAFESYVGEANGTLDEILDLGTADAVESREYLSGNLIRIADDATTAINAADPELDTAINDFFSAFSDFANVLSVAPAQQDDDARTLAVTKTSTSGDRISRLCE
ncbi:MAG: hypothetical protein KA421_03260 [Rhodoluna sp.]|nr:hypothetical protein [Rhodoluna sp.]